MRNLTNYLRFLDQVAFACGGFAVVYRAFFMSPDGFQNGSEDSQVVAVKFCDLRGIADEGSAGCSTARSKMAERWQREIIAGQSVQHPNILPFLGFCDNPDPAYKEFVGLVLPFCANGDARAYIRKRADADRMSILIDAGAAIFALHSACPPVVHGDIKSTNILIDDGGRAYLSDFGLSRICEIKGFTTESVRGTWRWMAVELLRASVSEDLVRTTTASDVWAFAMTILEILTGKVPFVGMNDAALLYSLVSGQARPSREDNASVSDAVWTLIEYCWREDPASRPDARHSCLALDIIYGNTPRELEPSVIRKILDGAWDEIVPPPSYHDRVEPALLPYKCKWLNCSQAFGCIDDCIAHELAEFWLRRIASVNLA